MGQIAFYTPEQFAKVLQVSVRTVYNWIKKGEVEAKRFGRVYRIPIRFGKEANVVDEFKLLELEDKKNLGWIQKELKKVRKEMWQK